MAGRFGAFAKLSRDDGGGRPTDTWSCARCSRRNSPALKRCENESCRAVRGDGRLDPARVPGRRHVDMGSNPARELGLSGAAAWPTARAPPRHPAARVDPRGPARARADADAEARSKYAKKKTTPILRNVDASGETRVSGTRTNATSRRDTRERDVLSDLPSDDMSKDERFINRTSVYNPTSPPDSDPGSPRRRRPGSPTRASRRRMSSWTRTATPRTTFSSRIPIQISRARIFKPRRREMREKKTVAAGPLKRRLH